MVHTLGILNTSWSQCCSLSVSSSFSLGLMQHFYAPELNTLQRYMIATLLANINTWLWAPIKRAMSTAERSWHLLPSEQGPGGTEPEMDYEWSPLSRKPSAVNSTNKRDLLLKVRVDLFIEMARPKTEAESQNKVAQYFWPGFWSVYL